MTKLSTWRTAAVLVAAALMPVVDIPADKAESAFLGANSERELVAAYVRDTFVFTGKACLLTCRKKWFEWLHLQTGMVYRMTKGEKLLAHFEDGSWVLFQFVGTAIGCPSGQCFEWMVGTERKGTRLSPVPPIRANEHPGKERGDHFVYGGSAPLPGRTLVDPYDEAHWAGGRNANW